MVQGSSAICMTHDATWEVGGCLGLDNEASNLFMSGRLSGEGGGGGH